MSAYDGVMVGKLKLKGKPLDVKSGAIEKKKKKKHNKSYHQFSDSNSGFWSLSKNQNQRMLGGDMLSSSQVEDGINESDQYGGKGKSASYDDHLTPAERRFIQQTEKLEIQRLSKMARRSHRDRIQQFNQYLANLSEHYDIPKVGPG